MASLKRRSREELVARGDAWKAGARPRETENRPAGLLE